MKLSAGLAALVVAAVSVSATNLHAHGDVVASSHRHSRLNKKDGSGSCSSKAPAAAPSAAAKPAARVAAGAVSLISVQSSCPAPIGATPDVTALTGPNGHIDWLNCGVDGAGWNPPMVKVSDLVAIDLSKAVEDAASPFKECSEFVPLFEQYGDQYGVPPIMLASFAMQESSCRPNAVGGGGEQGLMQITKDKCGAAPGGNCQDPAYNIMTGAKYFSDVLKINGGSVLKTIGAYNGWFIGMTVAEATAAASSDCCTCQSNLDYLDQFLNGWMLNRDPTSGTRLGKYFNLDVCRK
ncbi:hypothetical protein EWM64_g2658 [Hericium alpestre]|uniref:Transglycosylase SLT domain-containing protein n=1 Tax=Hericium alpestre TaxID=135208 RepID=A0A4Z0A6R7_9AGAM|nr:hypothetical protein EWM64_g2658 [Hericium alpestre]